MRPSRLKKSPKVREILNYTPALRQLELDDKSEQNDDESMQDTYKPDDLSNYETQSFVDNYNFMSSRRNEEEKAIET